MQDRRCGLKKPTANILTGDCRATMATLPEQHFHCCVTSPPYFGLRSYLDADHRDKHYEVGSEATPDEFVAAMLEVFGGKDNPVGVWRLVQIAIEAMPPAANYNPAIDN